MIFIIKYNRPVSSFEHHIIYGNFDTTLFTVKNEILPPVKSVISSAVKIPSIPEISSRIKKSHYAGKLSYLEPEVN